MRFRCPQRSLVQAGQSLRLGSRAHPLYIISAVSNVVSYCTNFWRLLLGDQRVSEGLREWTSQTLRESKSSEMTSGRLPVLRVAKDAESISLWNLSPLLIIAYHNTVGTRCGSSPVRASLADRRKGESEDRSKATAGSLKKVTRGRTANWKGGCWAASTGAWKAITRLRRFLLLARNPCPSFSGSSGVQCLPLATPSLAAAFYISIKSSHRYHAMVLKWCWWWHGIISHGHLPVSSWSDPDMVLSF